MERSVFTSTLCLTVVGALCGFRLPISQHWKSQIIVNTYCLIVTIIYCAIFTTVTVVNICYITYSFINIMELCTNVLIALLVTYYRIKFYSKPNTICDIYNNIVYIDQGLQRLGVRVPHARNRTQCMSFMILYSSLIAFYIFSKILEVDPRRYLMDVPNILMNSPVNIVFTVLVMHTYFTLYIIGQRVQLICCAVDNFDKLTDRNVAWSERVTLSVVGHPRSANYLTEVHENYKTICTVYRCINDTFRNARQLYSVFFFLYAFELILWYSIEIVDPYTIFPLYIPVLHVAKNNLLFIDGLFFVIDMIPMFICESICYKLKTLETTMNRLYYKRGLKNLRSSVENLSHQFLHRETKFNCRFFNVDFKLFLIYCDFISLLVFALLGTQ